VKVKGEMEISIVWGKSEGETFISAYDKSLKEAGIHNFNLITLSSVIPAGAVVVERGVYPCCTRVGAIRYVVLSSFTSDKAGTPICAALGWVLSDEGGLIFESCGEFTGEEAIKEIERGLQEMMSVRNWRWREGIKVKVVEHRVERVANVLVAAVYDSIPKDGE
jgi:arginine decarboxylase